MTESEWWAAADPRQLTDWLFFDARACDRKLRLFSVTGCEPLRRVVRSPLFLAALDEVEAFADERIGATELSTTHETMWTYCQARHDSGRGTIPDEVRNADLVCLYPTAQDPHRNRDRYRWEDDAPYALLVTTFIDHPDLTNPSAPHLIRLLHDIFGPLPFRDITADPSWLTRDVALLARGIYEEKAFDRMPMLADALQDAGCDSDDILNHCRAEGWEHVRGCWVIDLLLGWPWRESSRSARGLRDEISSLQTVQDELHPDPCEYQPQHATQDVNAGHTQPLLDRGRKPERDVADQAR
jgi:hypothetical protein